MPDHIARFVADSGLAISLIRCPDTVQRIAHDQHGLRGRPLRTVAEAIAASMLLATRLKGRGLLSWTLDTDGLLDLIRVDAIGLGEVRALVPERVVAAVADWNGFDPLLGKGTLTVARQLVDDDQPYRSVIPVDSGTVIGAVNRFLARSDQVSARIGLDLRLGDDEHIALAAGIYLEALPGCERAALPEAVRCWLESEELPDPDLADEDDHALLRRLFSEEFRELQRYPVRFACPCARERYIDTLRGFGPEQLRELTNGEGVIQTVCDFCKTAYDIPLDEVI